MPRRNRLQRSNTPSPAIHNPRILHTRAGSSVDCSVVRATDTATGEVTIRLRTERASGALPTR